MESVTVKDEKGAEIKGEILPSEGDAPSSDTSDGANASAQGKKKKKSPVRGPDGKFVKGTDTPKSPGRPKKPEELKKLMPEAVKTIEKILKSSKSDKVKLDAAKWVIEMNIGKPCQMVDASVEGKASLSAVVLNFEGELEKWSE